MKKSELTDKPQRVLIPAWVWADSRSPLTYANQYELEETVLKPFAAIRIKGAVNLYGVACTAYRHFILVDKWPGEK